MEQLLDEAFCEYALEKSFIDKNTLDYLKQEYLEEQEYITFREYLFFKNHISLDFYSNILKDLKTKSDIIDSQKSSEYDEKFINTGIMQSIFVEDEIKFFLEQAKLSCITSRELLLIGGIINLEDYQQIVDSIKFDQNEDPEKQNSDNSNFFPKDSSAETIIDYNPYEEIGVNEDDMFNKNCDSSAETIIDQDMGDIVDYSNNDEEDITYSKTRISTEQTLDISKDMLPYPREDKVDDEATLDISPDEITEQDEPNNFENRDFFDDFKLDEEPENIKPNNVDPRLKNIKSTQMRTFEENRSPFETLSAEDIIEDIVKKVNTQVNLQSQEISRTVVKGMGKYKILILIATFLGIFFLTILTIVEIKRYKELISLKKEKNQKIKEKEKRLALKEKSIEQKENDLREKKELESKLEILKNRLESIKSEFVDLKKPSKSVVKYANFKDFEANSQIAYLYLKHKKYKKSIEEFKNIAINSKNPIYNFYIALAYKNLKKYDESVKYMEKALNLDPENGEFYYELGNILYEKKDFEKAIENYKKSITNKYPRIVAEYRLVRALISNGNIEKGLSKIDELGKLMPEFYYIYNLKGMAFLKSNQLQEAFKNLEKAVELNKNDFEPLYLLAKLKMLKGDYKNAARDIDKALFLNPGCSEAYNLRGNIYLKLKEYEDALDNFEIAIDLNRKNIAAWIRKATTLRYLRKYNSALKTYEEAIKIDVLSKSEIFAHICILYVYQANYPKAENYAAKSLEASPSSPFFHFARGLLYLRQKKIAYAVKDFDEFVKKTTPENWDTLILISSIFRKLGKKDLYSKCMKKATKGNPFLK